MSPDFVLPSNKKDKVLGTIGTGIFLAAALAQFDRGYIIVLPLALALWCLWLTYNAYMTRLLFSDLAITLECKPGKDHTVDLTRLSDFQYGVASGQPVVYLEDEDERSLELSLDYFPDFSVWGKPVIAAVERDADLYHPQSVSDFRETVRTGRAVATLGIGSQVSAKDHVETMLAPSGRISRLLARALRRRENGRSEGQERD